METKDKKKIKKIGIKSYGEYPTFDWVTDQLIELADKINEIIEVINSHPKKEEVGG